MSFNWLPAARHLDASGKQNYLLHSRSLYSAKIMLLPGLLTAFCADAHTHTEIPVKEMQLPFETAHCSGTGDLLDYTLRVGTEVLI